LKTVNFFWVKFALCSINVETQVMRVPWYRRRYLTEFSGLG